MMREHQRESPYVEMMQVAMIIAETVRCMELSSAT